MHQVLSNVKKSSLLILELHYVQCAFGVLGDLHTSLVVPFEEHVLQDLEMMGLVRAGNFQFPLDLHHRRPQ